MAYLPHQEVGWDLSSIDGVKSNHIQKDDRLFKHISDKCGEVLNILFVSLLFEKEFLN